jgi:predicted SnoaL-like aldol condensation-catalyzing enzyme
MTSFQSLISTAIAAGVIFTACSGGTTDNEAKENNDTAATTAATASNASDANQQKLDDNKKLVTDFYQALYGDKDSTAIDKYVADDIKEHNPALQDGKEWLKNSLRPFLSNPHIEKTKMDIKHVAADGDMVWLLVRDVAPNGKEYARVNIFRVENGKIAEAWKVDEPVPAKSENKNGMF